MKLEYKPQVLKQLRKLPLSEKRKVIKKLELLRGEPGAGKPLKGELGGLLSVRAWPYRIIYQITQTSIIIYSVAHRQAAYK